MNCTKDDDNHKARPYQEELLELALKENVIIYLPTGAGKTFIAIMAIRHMSKDLEGSIRSGAKRSVYICNTVALAKQQCEVLKKQTSLKCSVYTGDLNVDNWKRDRWDVEFDNNQVIVATCQIIVDVVRHGFIKITDFNLMIFDECHNATGDHPMHQLMGLFQHAPQNSLPRVIGLTGVLIMCPTKNTIIKELVDLEAVFRAKIATVSDIENFKNVLIYSTKPVEVMITYDDIRSYTTEVCTKVRALVLECIEKVKNWKGDSTHFKLSKRLSAVREINPLKKLQNLLNDFIYQMDDMGTYGTSIAVMSLMVDLELKKRASETIHMKNLYRLCISYADRIRHILIRALFDDEDEDEENEGNIILLNSSPKVQKLLMYLMTTFSGKDPKDITCLVFVQRRMTAKNLYHLINRFVSFHKNIPIRAEFMVGRNNYLNESVMSILDDKWNRNVLLDFKRKECNLIVASSVLEEGIDIQSCNYVIVYDTIKTFRSYLQTKGRARMEKSTYAIIASEKNKAATLRQISDYREMDAKLKDFLIGKTIDRKPPLIEQTMEQFENVIQPFVTPVGARLEAESALPLLNRYCMGLPADNYTQSRLTWSKEEFVKPGYYTKILVKVKLPMQSTLKEDICSDPMVNVTLAKRSAAFNACKQLYLCGELSQNLLPVTPIICLENVKPLYFKHWEEFSTDNPRTAGTKKMRRVYKIEYPPEFVSAMPEPGMTVFLYKITVTPQFERNEDNSHIVDLLSTSSKYAIATTKQLPKLAAMPLFMSYGRVRAQIDYEPTIVQISNSEDLQFLRNFHVMLFRDLLRIWKNFFAYDYINKDNSFLIVPTTDGVNIDWNLVKNFQKLPAARDMSEIHRARAKYIPENFENRIINTWYSIDDKTRYVVLRIRRDLTPSSPFPNNIYQSFASYAEDKYKVKVVQKDQFLLEVKPITSRLNFLSPGGGEEGSKKKNKKLDDILLIPELCHNFRFPADMWQKASFIPCILHRMHYMLLAEQLRIGLTSHVNLDFNNYTPQDLIVDTTLKRLEETKPTKHIQAPVFPDPRETPAKPVNEIQTLVDNTSYKWKSYEEPCDLTRYLDTVYKVEVDYYHMFITSKLESMHITKSANEHIPIISNRLALCDAPTDDKLRINILEITDDTAKSPEQWELLAAITASSGNDVFDMERVELLGDSFLKFSISLYLLHKHRDWNEGYLTSVKGQFVSNRNLLYRAIKLHLPGSLKISSFKPRDDWQPPLLDVPKNAKELILRDDVTPTVLWELKLDEEEIQSGRCKDKTLTDFMTHFPELTPEVESDLNIFNGRRSISDKTCADSMEAILGVCVKNFGIRKSFNILNFMGICEEASLSNLLDIQLGSPRLRTNISDKEVNEFLINCNDLERNIGYKFNDRAYLLQALTHPSFPTNRLTGCYQQLEFIGDAILDFLISSYIFERCTHMDPGMLTDLRSALVNNVTLACLTVRHKIHLFILYQNAALSQAISKFIDFQQSQEYKVTDQCRILVDETNVSPSMADYIDVPKALGDVFEALIGAVFLDSKNDLKRTWSFIYGLMSQEIQEFMRSVPKQVVRRLYEYNGAGPVFSDPIVDEDVVMVKCRFTCRNEIREVHGFGKNKDQAKISASKIALQNLLQA